MCRVIGDGVRRVGKVRGFPAQGRRKGFRGVPKASTLTLLRLWQLTSRPSADSINGP